MKRRALLKSIVLGAAVAFPIARIRLVGGEPMGEGFTVRMQEGQSNTVGEKQL